MMQKNISVVISTYNSPDLLKKVIWGYNTQTYRNFEMVIADDGSNKETFDLIELMKKEVFFPIIHIRHQDNGFQKSQILNKAILDCNTAYILMSDGDCIPRPDFIEQHIKNRVEGVFLVGSSILISKKIEEKITKELIYSSKIFESIWLKKIGLNLFVKRFLITSNGLVPFFLDAISSAEKILKNDNLSFWKSDFEKVAEIDSVLVNSLDSSGLISKNIKFRAILLKMSN
jgi:glycosyltransferase involved in cell wall biosynthesis